MHELIARCLTDEERDEPPSPERWSEILQVLSEVIARPEASKEAATEAKDAFLAHMSHELRTPLTVVLGAAQLLASMEPTDEQRECVEAITKSGKVLLGLIDDVLDYSKMQAGSFDVVEKRLDLWEAVEDAVETQRGPAENKQLSLGLYIDDAVPRYVLGDPLRLKQVVINLVNNAVKYTRRGGITVRMLRGREDRIRVEVQDTGPGIGPQLLPVLFDPFSRGKMAEVHGTGLGLAITRQIVERLGGEVGAESEVGKGSCFWFEVSAARASAPAREGRLSGPIKLQDLQPVERKGHILVAEDNRFTQQILRRVLERLGHEVAMVGDGAACIEAVETGDYDLLLMDGQMPVVDGYTAAARIRELGEHGRRLPIIALTANARADARQTCIAAGMDDYLSKPFVLSDVAEVVDRWLEVATQRRAATTEPPEARAVGEQRHPPVDLSRLEELAGDDPAFREEIVDIFIEDLTERLDDLARAAANEDRARSVAHAIKGACGNFGARTMEGIARGICRSTRVEPNRVERAVVQLRAELSRVAEATGRTIPPRPSVAP